MAPAAYVRLCLKLAMNFQHMHFTSATGATAGRRRASKRRPPRGSPSAREIFSFEFMNAKHRAMPGQGFDRY